MFPEKNAEMNIKIGQQRFEDLNLQIWFGRAAFRSADFLWATFYVI